MNIVTFYSRKYLFSERENISGSTSPCASCCILCSGSPVALPVYHALLSWAKHFQNLIFHSCFSQYLEELTFAGRISFFFITENVQGGSTLLNISDFSKGCEINEKIYIMSWSISSKAFYIWDLSYGGCSTTITSFTTASWGLAAKAQLCLLLSSMQHTWSVILRRRTARFDASKHSSW